MRTQGELVRLITPAQLNNAHALGHSHPGSLGQQQMTRAEMRRFRLVAAHVEHISAGRPYDPNVHAARLLVADIFPKILRRCPDATLAIVGSDPPGWLMEAVCHEPRLTVTGWVPDVAPWFDAAQVVVCPLMVGGGVKIKILEALARGCAVVATPIALQGLRHLPPDAVAECADASAFADACVRLLGSPKERERQRARAAQAARYLPSWDLAADTVANAWSEIAAIATQA